MHLIIWLLSITWNKSYAFSGGLNHGGSGLYINHAPLRTTISCFRPKLVTSRPLRIIRAARRSTWIISQPKNNTSITRSAARAWRKAVSRRRGLRDKIMVDPPRLRWPSPSLRLVWQCSRMTSRWVYRSPDSISFLASDWPNGEGKQWRGWTPRTRLREGKKSIRRILNRAPKSYIYKQISNEK